MLKFEERTAYEPTIGAWALLPFRFERFSSNRVLLTNMIGEHMFVTPAELDDIVARRLPPSSPLVRRLRSRHIIRQQDEQLPLNLLAMKARTRMRRLAEFTSLHMFVVSLRCEHSCPYCQVSRQSSDKAHFDMSQQTAERALEMVFESPSDDIKIEFQGGEPLLNFELIEKIVRDAVVLNRHFDKRLTFVIA